MNGFIKLFFFYNANIPFLQYIYDSGIGIKLYSNSFLHIYLSLFISIFQFLRLPF